MLVFLAFKKYNILCILGFVLLSFVFVFIYVAYSYSSFIFIDIQNSDMGIYHYVFILL